MRGWPPSSPWLTRRPTGLPEHEGLDVAGGGADAGGIVIPLDRGQRGRSLAADAKGPPVAPAGWAAAIVLRGVDACAAGAAVSPPASSTPMAAAAVVGVAFTFLSLVGRCV